MAVDYYQIHDSFSLDGLPAAQVVQATTGLTFKQSQAFHNQIFCQKTNQSNFVTGCSVPFRVILFQAILVILITRTLRFLLKPLKQPRVVSEVIGGIIVGPSFLGLHKNIFPENAKYVVRTVGLMGFSFFLFITGVKMDPSFIVKSTKKQIKIVFFGSVIPCIITIMVALVLRPTMDEELARYSSIAMIAASTGITGFNVVYPILQELNLLSSEIGRLALSIALIVEGAGLISFVTFEAAKLVDVSAQAASWYGISTIVVAAFSLTALRRAMDWIVEKTPEGEVVEQAYIIFILLGALMMGFLADLFGVGIATGALWLGLVTPDGPPLGSSIAARSEIFVKEILMPFSYMFIGLYVDVPAMTSASWSSLEPLFAMALIGYVCKFLATLVVSLLVEMPLRDALTLSLITSLRGQLEFLLIMHWLDKLIIGIPSFTLMVLLSTAVTMIATPFITILYDPSKPYRVSKRKTVQHTTPYTVLKVVACIHDQESVAGLINLFDFSHPSIQTPFTVYALRLIEMRGQAIPMLIDHEKQEMPSHHAGYDVTHNALKLYEETKAEVLKLHSFTAVVPKGTMYQDICELAIVKDTSLIILPFHEEWLDSVTFTKHHRTPSVISSVLDHAPCSVAIFVEKGTLQNPLFSRSFRSKSYHFIMLFLGGADAREALVYADKMVKNNNVSLTVVRFLAQDHEGEDELEIKLDDGIITWFWTMNENNERVVYREVVVKNGEQTLAMVQALNGMHYDLWIIGRKEGINPVLLNGLSNWSTEHHELGVLGDYISSLDFSGATSVLVVQQQILRR